MTTAYERRAALQQRMHQANREGNYAEYARLQAEMLAVRADDDASSQRRHNGDD